MYKVLERIILDRLIKHREETTRDEQVGFRPGRSTIDQVFIFRRVIEIWQRYLKPVQLAFLDFEAAFDSPHRGRLLNAFRADGVPGKFVRLLDDMNQRTTAAVRTPAGCTTPFELVTGVRQGALAGPFLFNFAIDDIMRRTVDQCPADIVLAPSGCPVTDLEYAVVIFAESSTKLQPVVNLVSKLTAAHGLRLRPDKCKQMWISSRPRTGIRVDGQPIELDDEFCYLGCTLKNNGSYERDVQQRCAKAASAFNSLTKCLRSTPITNEVKLRAYLSAIRPIIMYGSETWAAPSTVMERLDCTEQKLLRRLLGYFWPKVCHNEDLYAEIDVVYQRMTCGRYQHLAPPSKAAKVNRFRFFGHILRISAHRLVQRVLKSSSDWSWKMPPGRKRKFWTEVVKEDLRTLGVDSQFRRDVRFRRIWNSDEWIDSVQALAEDREGWAELCSRTAHLGEDPGNRISDFGLSKIAEELEAKKKGEDDKGEPPIEHVPLRWMAPETLKRPQLWSIKSDVWSFGVLLYEVFNDGEKPWPNDEPKRIATHIRHGKMPTLPPKTPEHIKNLINKIWKLNPEERPSMDVIYKELKGLHKGEFKIHDASKLTLALKKLEKSKADTGLIDDSDSARSVYDEEVEQLGRSVPSSNRPVQRKK
ncbi:hypothetical protein RB195_008858 [Necator americanus]|uniref:Reverse transcriptase n=1 Tax=Necator americanus TaxID=51031 RepID=A0ABR1CQN2_NECAM